MTRWPGLNAAGVIRATGTFTQVAQSVFRANSCFITPVRSRWGDKAFFVPILRMGKLKSLSIQVVRPRKEERSSPALGSGAQRAGISAWLSSQDVLSPTPGGSWAAGAGPLEKESRGGGNLRLLPPHRGASRNSVAGLWSEVLTLAFGDLEGVCWLEVIAPSEVVSRSHLSILCWLRDYGSGHQGYSGERAPRAPGLWSSQEIDNQHGILRRNHFGECHVP